MSFAGNERVTNADLDRALVIYSEALEGAGIALPEGAHLGLDHGSKTYGRAFRLYVTGELRADGSQCSGHSRPPIGSDFLGMTKREAYEEMCGRASIIRETVSAMER